MAIINNRAYDGSTIEIDIEGVGTLTGVESINYNLGQEFAKVKGVGRKAVDYTPGTSIPGDASMELWVSETERWKQKAGSYDEMLNNRFDVTVSYRLPDEPLITVKLLTCRITSIDSSHSISSTDNLVNTINFQVLDVE